MDEAGAIAPLISFATAGNAPVISPNIPEPGAFRNRNYIELVVPKEHFRPVNGLVDGSRINSAAGESNQGALDSGFAPAQIAGPGVPSTTSEYNIILPSGVYSIKATAIKPGLMKHRWRGLRLTGPPPMGY
jgi:hypothetical protein